MIFVGMIPAFILLFDQFQFQLVPLSLALGSKFSFPAYVVHCIQSINI